MKILFLTLFFSCLVFGSAFAASPLATLVEDEGIVLLTTTGDNVRLRRSTALEVDSWFVVGTIPVGVFVLAEQWPVRDSGNEHLWYTIVAVIDAGSGAVIPIRRAVPGKEIYTLPYASAGFMKVTSWAETSLDKKTVLAQLAQTPYGRGYSGVDNSMAGQTKLVESKSLATWLRPSVANDEAIPMYKGPSEDSGLVEAFLLTSDEVYQADLVATDLSVPGWVQVESLNTRVPSGWIQQKFVSVDASEAAKNAGKQFILNIGANVPGIIRRWGPLVAVNNADGENYGKTELLFDGMHIWYGDYRNIQAELTRKGEGIGGIFVGIEGYDKAYIKSMYGDLLRVESGNWGERWKIEGNWDGWAYYASLVFDAHGLVSKIDFSCYDIDVSH